MTKTDHSLKVTLNGRAYKAGPDDGPGIVYAALQYLESTCVREDSLTSPNSARHFVRLKIGQNKSEVFSVLFLDSKHRMIEFREMFFGTIGSTSVHARDIVRAAIETNAAAVIFAHNHPSGVVEPSQADVIITNQLKEALEYIDVRVLDHFVVSQAGDVSMAERGMI